jgi:hypothetical protein
MEVVRIVCDGGTALILLPLPGRIKLEPMGPDIGQPHYVARSSIDTLTVLDNSIV